MVPAEQSAQCICQEIQDVAKTQLAREIGQQLFDEQNNDLIFAATLNTESIETLVDSYLTLGRHLGITEYALTSLESL